MWYSACIFNALLQFSLLYYACNLIHRLKLTRQSSAKFCKLVRSTRIPVVIVVAIVFRASIEITYPPRAWIRIKVNSLARICFPAFRDRALYLCISRRFYKRVMTTPGDEFAQTFRETWSRVKFCYHSPSLNPFIGGRAHAVSRNSRVTKLNLLIENVMENGYANTTEFNSVAPLPCALTNECSHSHRNDAETRVENERKNREREKFCLRCFDKSLIWVSYLCSEIYFVK